MIEILVNIVIWMESNPIVAALIASIFFIILLILLRSIKTDFSGNPICFDFSWIENIFKKEKN